MEASTMLQLYLCYGAIAKLEISKKYELLMDKYTSPMKYFCKVLVVSCCLSIFCNLFSERPAKLITIWLTPWSVSFHLCRWASLRGKALFRDHRVLVGVYCNVIVVIILITEQEMKLSNRLKYTVFCLRLYENTLGWKKQYFKKC